MLRHSGLTHMPRFQPLASTSIAYASVVVHPGWVLDAFNKVDEDGRGLGGFMAIKLSDEAMERMSLVFGEEQIGQDYGFHLFEN